MLVRGVFSSCAAKRGNDPCRFARRPRQHRGGAVSKGRSVAGRALCPGTGERGPDHLLLEAEGHGRGVSPHSTVRSRRLGCELLRAGSPSSPASGRPAAVRRWTATPPPGQPPRASLRSFRKLARVFAGQPHRRAAWRAGGEECALRCGAAARRRWRGSGERGAAGPCLTTRGTSRAPSGESRGPCRCVPAATRVWSVSSGCSASDARSHADQKRSRCAAEVQARAGRSAIGVSFGTPAPQSGIPDRAKVGKRTNRASAGRHAPAKGLRNGPLPGPTEGRAAGTHTGVWLLCHASGRTGTRPPETQERLQERPAGSPAQTIARSAARLRIGAPAARTGDGPR